MVKRKKDVVSYNMSHIRSKGSVIERALGKILRKSGFKYKKNYSKLIGKPDFVLEKKRIAIFCDSEFWHGKNWKIAKKEIKSNRSFWYPKIERNIARDKEVNRALRKSGWKVVRFWGKDIKDRPNFCIEKIRKETGRK